MWSASLGSPHLLDVGVAGRQGRPGILNGISNFGCCRRAGRAAGQALGLAVYGLAHGRPVRATPLHAGRQYILLWQTDTECIILTSKHASYGGLVFPVTASLE